MTTNNTPIPKKFVFGKRTLGMIPTPPTGKDSQNRQQGFAFRGIDATYNALHSVLAEHEVYTVPRVLNMQREERQTRAGGTLLYSLLTIEFDFIHSDGSKVTVGPVIGEGMDSGDKASNKAQSVAHKYALFMVFMIPTISVDPDLESHEVVASEPLATEKQYATINDFITATKIPKKHLTWIQKKTGETYTNWETLTAEKADEIINDCKEMK